MRLLTSLTSCAFTAASNVWRRPDLGASAESIVTYLWITMSRASLVAQMLRSWSGVVIAASSFWAQLNLSGSVRAM